MMLATPGLDFSSLLSSASDLAFNLFSASLAAILTCSSRMASLLALMDMDCHTNGGMCLGLLELLYFLALKPPAS